MYPLKNSATITIPFFVHDASGDAVTGLTDGSFTKRISKNGAAFGAMTVTITELENGWYSIPLSASHSDTNGILSITFTNAGAKQVNVQFRVHSRILDDLAYPTTSGRSIDVETTGEVGINLDNALGTLDAGQFSAGSLDGKGDWNIGKTAYALSSTGLDAITEAATGMIEIAKVVWNRILTGATHNIPTSAGRTLRQVEAAFVLHNGTAQAGSSNTITLDTGASAIDDFYNHAKVVITELTGVGQERIIVDYDGGTRVATIAPPWITDPDVTSIFEVEPGISHAETNSRTAHVGLAQAGAAGSITLSPTASAVAGFYVNDVVMIDAGTGEGQERIITAYDEGTKVATVEPDWATNPDTTSHYIVEEALVVADVFAISNDPTAADNLESDYDGTGFNKSNSEIGTCAVNTDMVGTDGAALASVCTEGRLAELDGVNIPADIAAVKAETVLIVADTNELQTDWTDGGRLDLILDIIAADTTTDIPALIAALNDISTADVLTQVNAALDTAIAELAQAQPSATPSIRAAIMLGYMALRNKLDVQTSGTDALEIYNDAGTLIAKKLLTDDGSDYSEAKMVSGA